jgi:hypothetical protein
LGAAQRPNCDVETAKIVGKMVVGKTPHGSWFQRDSKDSTKAYCQAEIKGKDGILNICGAVIQVKDGNTVGMKRHIESSHPGIAKDQFAKRKGAMDAFVKPKQLLLDAYLDWAVSGYHALNSCEDEKFRAMFECVTSKEIEWFGHCAVDTALRELTWTCEETLQEASDGFNFILSFFL